jgi:hypothetical protein
MNDLHRDGVTDAELDDALRRSRQIDPGCMREAVARYLAEIAEMTRHLDRLDLETVPAPVLFSPAWPARSQQ